MVPAASRQRVRSSTSIGTGTGAGTGTGTGTGTSRGNRRSAICCDWQGARIGAGWGRAEGVKITSFLISNSDVSHQNLLVHSTLACGAEASPCAELEEPSE